MSKLYFIDPNSFFSEQYYYLVFAVLSISYIPSFWYTLETNTYDTNKFIKRTLYTTYIFHCTLTVAFTISLRHKENVCGVLLCYRRFMSLCIELY